MLIIRQQQMEAFRSLLERDFVARLVVRAESRFPEQARQANGRAGLEARIVAAVGRARKYGLTSKRDVTRFIDMDFTAGPDFELAPGMEWARGILEISGLNGPTRLHRVETRLAKAAQAGTEEQPDGQS